MGQAVSLIINGVAIGAVYSLVALGLVVIYRASSVINFAQPGIVVLGAYAVASAHDLHGLPFPLAVGVGIAVAVAASLIVDQVLVRKFQRTNAVVAASIMTIGVDLIIVTETDRRIGSQILSAGDPWGTAQLRGGGIQIAEVRLAAIVVSLVLLVAFQLWLQRSDFGVAMRATADDPETAALMGVRLRRVSAAAWIVAGILAVCAAIFLIGYPSPGLNSSLEAVALRALPAAIIGGLDSTSGAIVGGLLIGVCESLVNGYPDTFSVLGTGFSEVVPYAVMLIVLLIRPTGLFGAREVSRV